MTNHSARHIGLCQACTGKVFCIMFSGFTTHCRFRGHPCDIPVQGRIELIALRLHLGARTVILPAVFRRIFRSASWPSACPGVPNYWAPRRTHALNPSFGPGCFNIQVYPCKYRVQPRAHTLSLTTNSPFCKERQGAGKVGEEPRRKQRSGGRAACSSSQPKARERGRETQREPE